MSGGDQFPPADAQTLQRICSSALSSSEIEDRLIDWLHIRYRSVWEEGYERGKRDAQVGGEPARKCPY